MKITVVGGGSTYTPEPVEGFGRRVDVRNDGVLAGLPDEAVVEVPAHVGTTLAIEAALTGDRSVARRALIANPLVRQWDRAAPLLDALLEANRRYLPRFFGDADE